MTHAKASLDPDFLKLRSELDHWRSTKKGHRIPDFLWHEAIRLTHQYGKQQVLRTLGLSPESFKQRTEKSARDQCQQVKRGPIEQPAFVEIPLTPPAAQLTSQEARFALRIRSPWGLFKIEFA